ncbi:hypothetical protein Tco_0056303 [Tanacetum coccineum]
MNLTFKLRDLNLQSQTANRVIAISIVTIYNMIITTRCWAQFLPLLPASPAVVAGARVLESAAAAFQSSLHHEDHEQEVLVPHQLSFYHVFT